MTRLVYAALDDLQCKFKFKLKSTTKGADIIESPKKEQNQSWQFRDDAFGIRDSFSYYYYEFFSLFFFILFQFSFSLYIAHRIGCSAAPVKPSWKRVFHISMFIYMNISLSGEIPAIRSEKRVQLPRNIFFFFLPLIDISDNNKTARKKTTIFNHYVAASPESFHAQNSAQDLDLAFWLSPSIRNRIPIRIRKKKNNNIDINFRGQPLQPQLPTLPLGS